MVSTDEVENPVHNLRLSSVVPARVTGDDKVHELTNMDLAMKLHYIRGLYFFDSDSVRGLDISQLKTPMFQWLDLYHLTCGRIRRSEKNGRPFIKYNDSGVRIVEGNCSKTLDEWLGLKDRCLVDDDQLVYCQVVGPDLCFSPLVFIQFTWFKCGGLSVGLSWAHILGDAFSASTFINKWGQIMAGHTPLPPQPLRNIPNSEICQFPPTLSEKPFSLKMVEPVGDYWLTANDCKMESHSFHITPKKLDHILSMTSGLNQATQSQFFEILAALMWRSLAKVRGESEPRVVTICKNNSHNRGNEIPSNGQVIGIVKADFKVEKAELLELIKLIGEKMVDERNVIEELVERKNEKLDFIVYGANLTFVDLEEVDIYGLQLKGKKPVYANYMVAGIGDEGTVLVLPGPENGKQGNGEGRTITVILPENQMVGLKNALRKEWGIF
ncbi:hypothetical protein HYC85_008233 [Camellia sinensis]|uniref:Uncharacterized protein n=1 Tax=Camellia sinensis TaxID=4442 RepID=A0A7J7HSN1_CAMSI|nr:hypothetical protein HYC85_008233 [Camellia sinensis]